MLVSTVLVVKGSDRPTQVDDEEVVLDESTRAAMLEDLGLARRLRERAAAIRRGRAKLPDTTRLMAAAAGTGRCPHPVPALRLRRLFVRTIERAPVSSAPEPPTRGLAEQMEEVAQRLDVQPNPLTAREDAAALLAAPPREIMFIVDELVLPRAQGAFSPGFAPGRATGRAVLVDVEAGLPLCVGRVSASSSQEVKRRDALDDSRAILDDFWRQVSQAINRTELIRI